MTRLRCLDPAASWVTRKFGLAKVLVERGILGKVLTKQVGLGWLSRVILAPAARQAVICGDSSCRLEQ